MNTTHFDEVVEHYHQALGEHLKGNPESNKMMHSQQEDVTLASLHGPPVRGLEQVAATMEHAASLRRDGEIVDIETVAKYVTPELAYIVEIERARTRIGTRQDITPYAVRATIIFRREDGVWKVVHRHADPITTVQAPESVLQK